jgi:hypothetical protein
MGELSKRENETVKKERRVEHEYTMREGESPLLSPKSRASSWIWSRMMFMRRRIYFILFMTRSLEELARRPLGKATVRV